MKRYMKYMLLCCICMGLLVFCSGCWNWIFPPAEWYIVTDVESYGILDGNGYTRANELFSAIFPAQIEDCFQDVTYSYKEAENLDTYDFEIYLEFVLDDSDKFQEYIKKIAPAEEWRPFEYDEAYLEYTYADWYEIDLGEPYSSIECAGIAKVLVQPNEHRVITVALGVIDGGGAEVEYFTCFFDRFNIDPIEYAERPDYNHQDILNGEHRK